MRGRLGTLLAASALVAATAGCGVLDAPPGPEVPAGCGECTSQVADLVSDLESSDSVRSVRSTRRQTTTDGYLGVAVDLAGKDVVSADLDALFDSVAEAAWRSGVTPLDTLSVVGTLRDGYGETVLYDFGADRTSFEDRWGKRPQGSEWTPVSEDDDDLEGCEVDGCHELMRGVAREASALPGVTAVVRSSYGRATPTNGSSADVDLMADDAVVVDDVVEQVAEIVWRSEVGPIDYISVKVETPNGGFPDVIDFQINPDHGRDHDRLEQMWGPRPAG
ncbi:hypothetical protein J2X46_004239 [Nocardioides sp. BE266]|uniref:hypothetical protein n=1 Tax=Nocardioides sp. BE266 TaxID=2817725 RepID=UPI002867AC4D|nr:hypothetical protein [Nocardioides sp. BE266]MDR7255237.1 hypothetical protein [Nocardioides sp. BE266]